tara:strand:+ start:512 stop:1441 length:930 start_codon:yes stop_codon:yes gene_type:complete
MHKIKGIYCASLTPINSDFSINKKLFLEHCERLLTQNIDGIAIFGTTGEASSFSIEEKLDAIHFLVDNKIEPNKLIPGTGLNSIKDTVYFTKVVSKLKVKSVLVLPPSYYKNISTEGITNYYKRVVEEVGEKNLYYLLYHYPQLSNVSIELNVIENLLHKYPENIVGIKDSSGNIDNMLKIIKTFDSFAVFSGSDSLALKVVKNGGAGAITAASNISAKLLSFIVNNWKKESSISKFSNLQKLQEEIRSSVFHHQPISLLKAYISIRDSNPHWNRVLPPLVPLKDPSMNTTVISLQELINKMEVLLSNS